MKTIQHKNTAAALIAVFLLILSPHLHAADSPAPMTLSLDEAVKFAQEHNPMLAASRGDADAAAARGRMAAAQRLPSLSTTAFLSNGDMPGILSGPYSIMPTAVNRFLPERYYDQNLMLMLPVDVFGRLSRTSRAANLRGGAAALDAERTRQDLVFSVRAMYYEVFFQDRQVGVYEDAVNVTNEQLKIDAAAADAGKIPSYYLERDKAEVAMNEQILAEARRGAAEARIRLAAMLGVDPSTPLELTDKLEVPGAGSAPDAPPPETPDTAAARARTGAADASLDAANRASAPEVSLTFMADRISSSSDGNMTGTTAALVVAFPLFDGGMRRAYKRESRAMLDAAAQEQRNTELQLQADFQSARLMFETAMKNIGTAEAAVKAAEENYRVAKIRYEAGKSILVELLDAITSLTRARIGYLQALRDASIARDTLLRLAGKF